MHSHDKRPLITLDGVWMQYDERRPILRDVNLSVNPGDFLAITGPNGGGKTTLLRLLLKLVTPSQGRVIYGFDNDDDRLPIGYLPQKNMIDSRFPITVSEVMELGLMTVKGMQKEARQRRVAETLELLGLSDHASSPIGEISGGQLQRTLFGRAIISHPQMLVLDEPLSYLDKHNEEVLYNVVKHLAEDTTIVIVSHEMSTISTMATRHIVVDHSIDECHAATHYAGHPCH